MQQTDTKRIQEQTRLGEKDDPLGIVQEIKIWPYYQMVDALTRLSPKNEKNKILWDFETQTNHLIPIQRLNFVNQQEEKDLSTSGFCHSIRQESENKRKRKDSQIAGSC